MNSAVSDVEPRVASRAGLPGCCPQAAGSGRPGVSWAPQRGGKMAWDRCSHFSESSPFSFYSLPRPLPSQDTVLGGVQRRAGRAHGDRKQGLPCKSLEAASYMTCDRVALISAFLLSPSPASGPGTLRRSQDSSHRPCAALEHFVFFVLLR